MTHNEMIKKCMRTEHGMFRPLYTHKKEVPIYDSEKNIIDWELVDYKEIKSAQEVYDEWLENKDKTPIIEEDKITILLLNGSTGKLQFEKKDNIVFVTGNITSITNTIIGRLPSNLYPKEDVYISGLIIYTNGDILFSNESISINGFYII